MKSLRIFLLVVFISFVSNITAQTVYTTKTGEKYHKSSCRYLKYSKKETTIKKAKALGYIACKVCKPTAENTQSKKASASSNSKPELSSSIKKNSIATQCTGKTKSGARCKRKTKNTSGRCYQHE